MSWNLIVTIIVVVLALLFILYLFGVIEVNRV